jgi:hypothetical protein
MGLLWRIFDTKPFFRLKMNVQVFFRTICSTGLSIARPTGSYKRFFVALIGLANSKKALVIISFWEVSSCRTVCSNEESYVYSNILLDFLLMNYSG